MPFLVDMHGHAVPGAVAISLAPEVVELLQRLAELHGAALAVRDGAGRQVAMFGTAPGDAVQATAHSVPAEVDVALWVPAGAGVSPAALAEYAAALVGQVGAVRHDLDLMAEELLERYEEVTLLHEVSHDLGVVVDIPSAAQAALDRTLRAIPAQLGKVLVQSQADDGRVTVAQSGTEDPIRAALSAAVAQASLGRRGEVLVHAGQRVPGSDMVAAEPALGVPVQLEGAGPGEQPPGVLVLVGNDSHARFSAGEAQLAATVARQLAVGLENGRLVSALREKERLEHELGLAAGIQAQLLAGSAPVVPGASLRAVCLPAEHVGGDYYDFVVAEDGAVTTVVADVTGHGVGPALIMAMTRSVLRAEFHNSASLTAALTATNATMWEDLLATGLFITVFALTFDPDSGRVRFVNGGHHPALLRHPDGRVEELDSEGMPIGLLPDPGYEDGEAVPEPGSVLLLFSDGVVETRAPDGRLFGTPRLVEFLREEGTHPHLVDGLLAELEKYRAGAPQQDDVTVVEVRIDPPAATALGGQQ